MRNFGMVLILLVIGCSEDQDTKISEQGTPDNGGLVFSTDTYGGDTYDIDDASGGTDEVVGPGSDAINTEVSDTTSNANDSSGMEDVGQAAEADTSESDSGAPDAEEFVDIAELQDIGQEPNEEVGEDAGNSEVTQDEDVVGFEDVDEFVDVSIPDEDIATAEDVEMQIEDIEEAGEDLFEDVLEEDVQTPMLATVTISFSNETKIAYQQGTNFHYPKTYLPGEWTLTIDQKTKIWVYGSEMEIFSNEAFQFWTDNTKGPFGWADGPPQGEETSLLLNFQITQWVNILLE